MTYKQKIYEKKFAALLDDWKDNKIATNDILPALELHMTNVALVVDVLLRHQGDLSDDFYCYLSSEVERPVGMSYEDAQTLHLWRICEEIVNLIAPYP